MRWDDAVEGYWLTRRRSLSEATVLDYALTFRRFGAWIENGELKKVKAAQVNAFLEHLEEDLDLAPKTVLNAWIALSSFWTWAQTELKITHVMRQVARPKARPRPMQAFTEDEVRRLLAAATTMNSYDRRNDRHVPGQRPSSARNAAIVLLLVDAGLRASELCELQFRDYDRKSGRLMVEHGKGDKQRVVYLGQSAQRALWRYMTVRPDVAPMAPIIASSRGGPMDRSGLRKLINRFGKTAGVIGATPHRFRHTFAINFLRNGGNMAALQDLLGHASMEMVRRYAHLAEVDLAQAQKTSSPADRWRL